MFCQPRSRRRAVVDRRSASRPSGGSDLDRRAVVFKRPLPYVYLARDVFADAGIPYQTFDALPLAAEPYAAALDLVFEFVTSNFTREPVVALLGIAALLVRRSTALRCGDRTSPRLNRALSDEGYFGGAERLRAVRRWKDRERPEQPRTLPTNCARLPVMNGPPCSSIACWRFSTRTTVSRRRTIPCASAISARAGRCGRRFMDCGARTSVWTTRPAALSDIAAMIRRWIEGQTFAPRAGTTGVQLLDAQAARYGEFDEVFLVGLVEGEWPQRSSKSIFYPSSLLSQLDWPDSSDGACRRACGVSGPDGAGAPSGPPFHVRARERLDRRPERVSRRRRSARPANADARASERPARIFVHEALASDPVAALAL